MSGAVQVAARNLGKLAAEVVERAGAPGASRDAWNRRCRSRVRFLSTCTAHRHRQPVARAALLADGLDALLVAQPLEGPGDLVLVGLQTPFGRHTVREVGCRQPFAHP